MFSFVIELYLGQVFHLYLFGVVDDELIVLQVVAGHITHVSVLCGPHRQLQPIINCFQFSGLHLTPPHHR